MDFRKIHLNFFLINIVVLQNLLFKNYEHEISSNFVILPLM